MQDASTSAAFSQLPSLHHTHLELEGKAARAFAVLILLIARVAESHCALSDVNMWWAALCRAAKDERWPWCLGGVCAAAVVDVDLLVAQFMQMCVEHGFLDGQRGTLTENGEKALALMQQQLMNRQVDEIRGTRTVAKYAVYTCVCCGPQSDKLQRNTLLPLDVEEGGISVETREHLFVHLRDAFMSNGEWASR
jgi:hypothetical protein